MSNETTDKNFTERLEKLIRTQETCLKLIPEQKSFNQEFVDKLSETIEAMDDFIYDLQDAEKKVPMSLLDKALANNSKLIDEYEMI